MEACRIRDDLLLTQEEVVGELREPCGKRSQMLRLSPMNERSSSVAGPPVQPRTLLPGALRTPMSTIESACHLPPCGGLPC